MLPFLPPGSKKPICFVSKLYVLYFLIQFIVIIQYIIISMNVEEFGVLISELHIILNLNGLSY